MEAELALRSCSHLSDAYLTLPPAAVTEKRYVMKDEQNDYLGKLLGKGATATTDKVDHSIQAPARRVSVPGKVGPDLGLDAMAMAVSLRCIQPIPVVTAPAKVVTAPVRSSLDVLLDAATCRYSFSSVK